MDETAGFTTIAVVTIALGVGANSAIFSVAAAVRGRPRAEPRPLRDGVPWDPVAWLVSAGTLLVVAVLASWMPARRALRVDPVVARRA